VGVPKSGIGCLSDLFGAVARAYLIGEAAADFARTLEGGFPSFSAAPSRPPPARLRGPPGLG